MRVSLFIEKILSTGKGQHLESGSTVSRDSRREEGRRRKSHLFCCCSFCFCSLDADVCRSHAEVSRAGATRSNSHLRRSVPLRTTVTAYDVWRWNGKEEDTKITKTSDTKKENNRKRSTLSNKMQLMFREFKNFFFGSCVCWQKEPRAWRASSRKSEKRQKPDFDSSLVKVRQSRAILAL